MNALLREAVSNVINTFALDAQMNAMYARAKTASTVILIANVRAKTATKNTVEGVMMARQMMWNAAQIVRHNIVPHVSSKTKMKSHAKDALRS